MWITSMGNHGVSGGISERRRSSCFSLSLKPDLSSLSLYIYMYMQSSAIITWSKLYYISNAMTAAECIPKDTPYLTLTGELYMSVVRIF